MDFRDQLKQTLGLEGVPYRYELSKHELFHEAIARDRGRIRSDGSDDEPKAYATALGERGPLVYYSDPDCTGRPVNDTFAVGWPEVDGSVWWKESLKSYDPDDYQGLLRRVVEHVNARRVPLYVKDLYAGTEGSYAIPFRFVGEYATHAFFAHNMFPKRVDGVEREDEKRWTMLNVPSFRCRPERDGSRSDRAVVIDFRNRIALVVGRADYCGVVKKTLFTVMNYRLPELGHLSMHCSANIGPRDDTAILFGLSGTGKTTLSADPERRLIGDDEAAWTDEGVSNLEDGCYAKLIDLDKEAEPVIGDALSMEGTLIENVPPLADRPLSETHPQELDLTDRSVTENTRFSYPLDCNPNIAEGARGGHPETIVLLTADAFGVLPPVSVLSGRDVMYHFVQGFTSKLAGTEVGVKEPQATFSACFGAPFMAHRPSVYARLLRERMEKHQARCVLLNTGWHGGPAGRVPRIPIRATRAMLDAALRGDLHGPDLEYDVHPVFKLKVPRRCPGVDAHLLDARGAWTDKSEYDAAAARLRELFRENFRKHRFGDFGIEEIL